MHMYYKANTGSSLLLTSICLLQVPSGPKGISACLQWRNSHAYHLLFSSSTFVIFSSEQYGSLGISTPEELQTWICFIYLNAYSVKASREMPSRPFCQLGYLNISKTSKYCCLLTSGVYSLSILECRSPDVNAFLTLINMPNLWLNGCITLR